MSGISSTSPLQLESYEVNFDTATGISSGSAGLTNVTNVSGIVVLSSIAIHFNAAVSGAWSGQLEIQVNGGPTRTLILAAAGVLGPIRHFQSVQGTTDPVTALIPIGLRFSTSLRVGINITVAAGSNVLDCTVCRGVAL